MPLQKNCFKHPPRQKFNVSRQKKDALGLMRKYLSLEEQRPSGHILAILSVHFLGAQINPGKTEKTLQKLDLLKRYNQTRACQKHESHLGASVQQIPLLPVLSIFYSIYRGFFQQKSLNGSNTGNVYKENYSVLTDILTTTDKDSTAARVFATPGLAQEKEIHKIKP